MDKSEWRQPVRLRVDALPESLDAEDPGFVEAVRLLLALGRAARAREAAGGRPVGMSRPATRRRRGPPSSG